MKKCPFCGADIEDSARFCLYCMQSLTKKEQIPPHQKKKPRPLTVVATIVIPLLMLVIVCYSIHLKLKDGKTPLDDLPITETTHIPAEKVIEKYIDSSCTEIGSYDEVVYCSVCGDEISRTQKTIAPRPHKYDQKITASKYLNAEATCTDSAVYYYSCICGEKGSASFADGEANGHSYASTWGKSATHHWHSAICEHTAEISEMVEHNYGTDNICDTCGYDRTVHVSGVELNFSFLTLTVDDEKILTATITPNNSTDQNREWTTSNASAVTVDASGRITAVGVGTATVTVTTADGNKTAQCTVVVSAKVCPHTTTRTEREDKVAVTCEVAGRYDDVVYCADCGDELSRSEKTVPSPGHSFGDWIVDTVATCTKAGTRHQVCTACKTSVSESYTDTNAHSYDSEWTVNATYHWHTCSKCNSVSGKKAHLIDGNGKCSFCSYQTTPSTDGIIYMISEDGTYAEVIDYTSSEKNVVISTVYKGVPVTKIGKFAFYEKNITSIDIPNSITSIGDCAFEYCRNLASVTIGNSVTSIGNSAFSCCALTDLTIPDSVKSIGMAAFYANSNLANVKIGNGVTVIEMSAFKGCQSLISVTLPNGVERIENDVFYDCFALTSVTLGDNVTHIGNEAFFCCSNLKNITIPDSITTVGSDAFFACYDLTEKVNGVTYVDKIVVDVDNAAIVELREGTRAIAASAFSKCIKLRKVTIPDSVLGIGSAAFAMCENLESVIMSKNLKIIGDRAFCLCKNLSSIVIPASVTCIDHQAFSWCERLTNIKYCGTETQWEAISKGLMWDDNTNYTLTYNYTGA